MTETRLEAAKERLRISVDNMALVCREPEYARALLRVLEKYTAGEPDDWDPQAERYAEWIDDCNEILAALEEK